MAIEFSRKLSASELAALVNKIAAERTNANRPIDVTRRTYQVQNLHALLEQNGGLDYQVAPGMKVKVRYIAGRLNVEVPGSTLEQDRAVASGYGTEVRVRR